MQKKKTFLSWDACKHIFGINESTTSGWIRKGKEGRMLENLINVTLHKC